MKPETMRLKTLLAELGIPRTENTVNTGSSGIPIGILLTDEARKVAITRAEEINAQGYSVLLYTYRCGCPASVWLCASSSASLRRTVRSWTHECTVGAELLPVTPIDWLTSEQDGDGDVR